MTVTEPTDSGMFCCTAVDRELAAWLSVGGDHDGSNPGAETRITLHNRKRHFEGLEFLGYGTIGVRHDRYDDLLIAAITVLPGEGALGRRCNPVPPWPSRWLGAT